MRAYVTNVPLLTTKKQASKSLRLLQFFSRILELFVFDVNETRIM